MTDTDRGLLKCPQCKKEYPEGSLKCKDDGAELTAGSSSPGEGSVSSGLATQKRTPSSAVTAALDALDFTPALEGIGDGVSITSANYSDDQLIGKLFAEKYDIISLLGEGGMSKVYKARHRFMKRIVAVKLLHEEATRDPMAKARFQQEAEAASALSHQNVVTVHDFGFTPSGQAFFVMDCLEGLSLEQILDGGQALTLEQSIEIFTQGCDGLDHAHRKGIVHRDIKPSNIVVIKQDDNTDLVKLVDFGIAKVMTPPQDDKTQRQLTQAGEVFGTPAYMSPEQCAGKTLDGRSDLYSFGCLMYEALSGQPPLLGETFINTVVKHINEKPKSFAESAPHAKVPPHIEAVVMKCLEKDPQDRYASALELKQALFDAAFASGLKGLRFGAVPEPKRISSDGSVKSQALSTSLTVLRVTRRWRMSFALTLGVIAVGLAALGWWLFFFPGPDGDTGTLYSKMSWQRHLAVADDLTRQNNYAGAIKELEQAKELAGKFGDGFGRLEATLNKLSTAYGYTHDYAAQEAINKQLAQLVNERLDNEYNVVMTLLKQWDTPSSSNTASQEHALQAAAFSQRIMNCADKLSLHSRVKQEVLLKKAIKVFDSLDTRDWQSGVKFRLALAECYRQQQRYDDLNATINDAIKLCPEKPNSPDGWRTKIQAQMLLGQLQRNTAMNEHELDISSGTLESALNLVRTQIPSDKDLLKDALNGMAIVDRLYHKKEYDDKAKNYEKEAIALEAKEDNAN